MLAAKYFSNGRDYTVSDIGLYHGDILLGVGLILPNFSSAVIMKGAVLSYVDHRGCAIDQGILLETSTPQQDILVNLHLRNRVYFLDFSQRDHDV